MYRCAVRRGVTFAWTKACAGTGVVLKEAELSHDETTQPFKRRTAPDDPQANVRLSAGQKNALQ